MYSYEVWSVTTFELVCNCTKGSGTYLRYMVMMWLRLVYAVMDVTSGSWHSMCRVAKGQWCSYTWACRAHTRPYQLVQVPCLSSAAPRTKITLVQIHYWEGVVWNSNDRPEGGIIEWVWLTQIGRGQPVISWPNRLSVFTPYWMDRRECPFNGIIINCLFQHFTCFMTTAHDLE